MAANFYQQVVTITATYLGPAAERFVGRQVRNHLHKEPETLVSQDLPEILDWIKLSMMMLSDNTELVDKYINDLSKLMKTRKMINGHGKTRTA